MDERAWLELEAVVARAMSARSPGVQRQLIVFLRLLQTLPLARYGRPFTSLSAPRRHSFLESMERSRLLLFRRGFWGLRSLVFMGYYTRDDVAKAIGYRSVPGGWEARGRPIATVPLSPALWVEP